MPGKTAHWATKRCPVEPRREALRLSVPPVPETQGVPFQNGQ